MESTKELTFKIIFKRGPSEIAVVTGYPISANNITVGELQSEVIRTEQFLEKLTGLRTHIEMS